MGHVFFFFLVRCRQDHCGTWSNHLTDPGPIWGSGSLCYTWLVVMWSILSGLTLAFCSAVATAVLQSSLLLQLCRVSTHGVRKKSKNINEREPIQEWARRNGTPLWGEQSIKHLKASLLTTKCVSGARYYCIFVNGLRGVWRHGGSC